MLVGGRDAVAEIGNGKAVRNLPRPEFRNTQAIPLNDGQNGVGISAALIRLGPHKGNRSINDESHLLAAIVNVIAGSPAFGILFDASA